MLSKIHRYRLEIQNLHNLYPSMGLQMGYSALSHDQNNCDLSGTYAGTYKHARNAAWCAKIVEGFCLHLFLSVWSAKTRIPPLELHGWRCHYTGRDLPSISVQKSEQIYSLMVTGTHLWQNWVAWRLKVNQTDISPRHKNTCLFVNAI